MNPVRLKPERDTANQVVVQGRVDAALSRRPWRERSAHRADIARVSLARLQSRHGLLLIEGAGWPGEINLAAHDCGNLQAARWSGARCLLVRDIDCDGA